jgi:hypothetical protein
LPSVVIPALAAVAAFGVVGPLGGAGAAAATAAPATPCLTECAATFDTPGQTATFTPPAGIATLSVTVSGAAGAAAPVAITHDPTARGGRGGSATIDLGPFYVGYPFSITLGGVGGAAQLKIGDSLIAMAGGGGGGGYAGYLDQPDQILATYPGGDGGAPTDSAYLTEGAPGVAFGDLAANGQGATDLGGSGGTGDGTPGDVNGKTGHAADYYSLESGGAGASAEIAGVVHTAGAGGDGYAGGGGGAIDRGVDNGDTPVDLVAPGGGGSGYLLPDRPVVAEAPNTGAASIVFHWSYAPAATTTATSVQPGDTVPVSVTGLPPALNVALSFDGTTVATGSTGSDGTASLSFVVGAAQRAGSFPIQLIVGDDVVASTAAVSVTVPAASPSTTPTPTPTVSVVSSARLADTGSTTPMWPIAGAGMLLVAGVAALGFARLRASRTR